MKMNDRTIQLYTYSRYVYIYATFKVNLKIIISYHKLFITN